MYKNCYGIIDVPNLAYSKNCFIELENYLKDLLLLGATSFMIGDCGKLSTQVYKICKNLQKKKHFTIKVVSTNIENKDLLNLYKNDEIIFIPNEIPSSVEFSMYRINQFIANNTCKCVSFASNLQYFGELSKMEFNVIDIDTNKQIVVKPKNNSSPIDTSDIILMD